MRSDLTRLISTHLIAVGVIAAGFYSLVIYPFVLDDLVKGAIIGFMTLAMQSVFSEQVAARTGTQQQNAFDAGLTATPASAMPTVTATAGPTPTATVSAPQTSETSETSEWHNPTTNTRGDAP
jgi:hypothetical protein